jgi:cobalt-zinc-cadmium efflux system protein
LQYSKHLCNDATAVATELVTAMSRKSKTKVANTIAGAANLTDVRDVGNDTVREDSSIRHFDGRTSDKAEAHGEHEVEQISQAASTETPAPENHQHSGDSHHHDHHDHAGHDSASNDIAHHHNHNHGHHAHHHVPSGPVTKAFAVGVALNTTFVVVGIVAGLYAGSTALLADAAHNLGDVVGLLLGWGATVLAQSAPTERRTYGFRRATIIAALANSLLIVFAVGAVGWESLRRLADPAPVNGGVVALVAALGVIINVVSARMFIAGQQHDLNQRGAYLHLLGDAAVSAGVVVAGIIVKLTGWTWADPLTSIIVSVIILWSAWRLLKESALLILDVVPPHIDPARVRAYLLGKAGVSEVHDLHIWSMSTSEVALTAHLVINWSASPPAFMAQLDSELQSQFGIHHATVQLETNQIDAGCNRAKAGSL